MTESMFFKMYHIAQMLALGFDWGVEKPYYRRKTSLVVGGTRTRVLADSMTIAATALDHCTTETSGLRPTYDQ